MFPIYTNVTLSLKLLRRICNFRSSSLDDLQWVTSAADMPRMEAANPPKSLINYRSNTLPCEGRGGDSRGRSPVTRQNGSHATSASHSSRHSCYEQRHVSGYSSFCFSNNIEKVKESHGHHYTHD